MDNWMAGSFSTVLYNLFNNQTVISCDSVIVPLHQPPEGYILSLGMSVGVSATKYSGVLESQKILRGFAVRPQMNVWL